VSADKRSSLLLLCVSLAVACLLGVFAIMDASTATANQGEVQPPAINLQPGIVFSPSEMQATLLPGEQLTQTLWITNTGDSELTIAIYEMTATLRIAGFTIEPAVEPLVDPQVRAQVEATGNALAIIFLREQPDLSPAYQISNRTARVQYVYDRLLQTASHSQELFQWLEQQGTEPRHLLVANAIAARIDATQLELLAGNPQVKQVSPNRQYDFIPEAPSQAISPELPAAVPLQPNTVEWNIAKIRADKAWNTFGVRGEGAVVGIIDTGVMYDHPALVNSYRGNLGEGVFDHNYNWYDFVNQQPVPYDPNDHGTMGAGLVSGDDGEGNQIGVAPGAKWIAVKACDAVGGCDDADLLAALDWMLVPFKLDGNDPDPSKAPNVVLNNWGGYSPCDPFFEPALQALAAANILSVFAPGGAGPSCNTIGNPADLMVTLTAGATDENDIIASFSPRGPGCGGFIKPDVTAPGVNIRTSNNDGNYSITSGTSWSTAQTAGAAAMLFSADPNIGLSELRSTLYTTALCIDDDQCGGGTCPAPNNVYGHGRIDVYQAVLVAMGNPPPVELPWLYEAPLTATLPAGGSITIDVTFDSSDLELGTYTGALAILSNDPVHPLSSVPVTLDVVSGFAPIISVDPLSLSATLPIDGVQTDTLTISNLGDADLTFNLEEISPSQHLAASPVDLFTVNPFFTSTSSQVDADVSSQLLFLSSSRLIIYLGGHMNLSAAQTIRDRTSRVQFVYGQLLKLAAQSDELYTWLVSQGTHPRRLLTANAIAATMNIAQLNRVLSFPQVERVALNGQVKITQDEVNIWDEVLSSPDVPGSMGWNISQIRADETWSNLGVTGQGAVVGIVDTGVMYDHPALVSQYRGNLGGGDFDHNYNWYDLVYSQTIPYDDNDHGTFGAGIVVGDDGEGNQIGVAPGAKWIAVKALDAGGSATEEDLHTALQWMLAPTDINGENPDPAQAPQVVLNMWGLWGGCIPGFEDDLDTLRAANIMPVFAPGGEGPSCSLVRSPADYPTAITAGATDINDDISGFSAKGPSCFDNAIKPDVAAPGVDVRSSNSDGGYEVWSGTSLSSAHLAGAATLLFSANPDISLDQLEQALFETAVCHEDLFCGGEPCPGPNNTYGYGRIDVFEAVSEVLEQGYDIPWLDENPISGTIAPGESLDITVIFDGSGLLPETYLGSLDVVSNDAANPHVILPITLTVTAPCEPVSITDISSTPTDPQVNEVITFTATATGTLPISYAWDFGDGSTAEGEVVTHSFIMAGMYIVSLSAENACHIDQASIDVMVGGINERTLLPLVYR
jgi:subtilisin family serine protease